MTGDLPKNFPKLRDRISSLFLAWIEDGNAANVTVEDLDTILSGIALEPSRILNLLGVAAAEAIEKKPEPAVNITMRISGSGLPQTRALCAVIISQLGKYQPTIWLDMIKHLARDDVWDIRDFAARIFDTQPECTGLAEFHLDFVIETLTAWTKDSDYLLRRLPARALLGYAAANSEVTPKLLELLGPLFKDPSEYVRRNLVSALRALGRGQPDAVFACLESRVAGSRGHTRDIIRMVLDSGFAHKQPERTQALLDKLDPAD